MALAETARLIASLELQDKFTGTIKTVESKLDGITRKLDTVGTRAKTRFGQLRDAAKDTNKQTTAVGLALAGIERFVPPSIRPLVEGLETLNNQSPKGLLALIGSGIKTGGAITVKVIEDVSSGLSSKFSTLVAALTSPSGIGVQGRMVLIGETIGLVFAVNAVATAIRDGLAAQAAALEDQTRDFAKDASVQDLQAALDSVDSAVSQLKADPIGTFILGGPALDHLASMRQTLHDALAIRQGDVRSPDRIEGQQSFGGGGSGGAMFSLPPHTTVPIIDAFQLLGQNTSISQPNAVATAFQMLKNAPGDVKWVPAGTIQVEDRRAGSAYDRFRIFVENFVTQERLERSRLNPPIINNPVTVNVRTNVFGTTSSTSTTVYSRYNTSNGAIVV